jgi:ubiquinone biosynthesis protein UbiJ
MKEKLLALLETTLNRYVNLDPESHQRIEALEGKVVTVELKGIGLCFQLFFNQNNIKILSDLTQPADVTIKGTPLRLAHAALSSPEKRSSFFKDDVSIEGNLELGFQLIDLFDHIEIDWEEYASRVIGDFPAYQLGKFVNNLQRFLKRTDSSLQQTVTEYVHEEIKTCPPREALADFFNEVDHTRMDVDRLEARIKKLREELTE